MLRAHEADRESSNGLKLSEGFAKNHVYDELMYGYDGKFMLASAFSALASIVFTIIICNFAG